MVVEEGSQVVDVHVVVDSGFDKCLLLFRPFVPLCRLFDCDGQGRVSMVKEFVMLSRMSYAESWEEKQEKRHLGITVSCKWGSPASVSG